jgi:hypothetical protein
MKAHPDTVLAAEVFLTLALTVGTLVAAAGA